MSDPQAELDARAAALVSQHTAAPVALTSAELEHFDRVGWVMLPRLLPSETVEPLYALTAHLLSSDIYDAFAGKASRFSGP